MVEDFLPDESMVVRTVETCGARFVLSETDVVAVLTLCEDDEPQPDRAVLVDMVGDLLLPLVSLGERLCLSQPAEENQVVVLRQDGRFYGLLVERADAPTPALLQDVVDDTPWFAAFGDVVRLSDGTDMPVIDPDRLAPWTIMPAGTARH